MYLFLIGLLILLIILLIYLKSKQKVFYFLVFNKIFKRNLFKTIVTHEFIIYYLECLRNGMKTKEALDVLKNFKRKPFISLVSFHIDNNLLKALKYPEALKLDFLDAKLYNVIKLAYYTSQNDMLLQAYLDNNVENLKYYIKKVGIKMQIISYLICGLVVYFIYQILLAPLAIIERL